MLLTVVEYFWYLTQCSFKNSSLISRSCSISDVSASFGIQSASDHSCAVFHLSTDLEPTWFQPALLPHLSCVKCTQHLCWSSLPLQFQVMELVFLQLTHVFWKAWESLKHLLFYNWFLPTVGPLDPCWFISLWIHVQFQFLVIKGFIMCPLRVIWVCIYVSYSPCLNREGWTDPVLYFPANSLFRPTKLLMKEIIYFYEIYNVVTEMSNFREEESIFSVQ